MDRSINHSIKQASSHPIKRSIKQSITRSFHQSIKSSNQSIDHWINQLTDQTINRPIMWSIEQIFSNQSNQSINLTTDQLIEQSTHQPPQQYSFNLPSLWIVSRSLSVDRDRDIQRKRRIFHSRLRDRALWSQRGADFSVKTHWGKSRCKWSALQKTEATKRVHTWI